MDQNLQKAIQLLQQGELVAFPTETVYGLGADASSTQAVKKIFALKGRPANHPVIVHLAHSVQVSDWAKDIPAIAWQLAKAFWPGPLTLILKRSSQVPDAVTGGQDTVGLRIPSHPVAQSLLQAFGGGIAAPSANHFGHISPTKAEHVRQEFPDLFILEGDEAEIGLESTIIDLSSEKPRLLRPGGISLAEIEKVIGKVERANKTSPRASGMLKSHYAPNTPTLLLNKEEIKTLDTQAPLGVLLYSFTAHELKLMPQTWRVICLKADAKAYGQALYHSLRELESTQAIIIIERPPQTAEWLAVQDRLKRASAHHESLKPDQLKQLFG
ncbi:MAG: L-threonylcarbamoyladenylate synthase [Deinococcales bacterium]